MATLKSSSRDSMCVSFLSLAVGVHHIRFPLSLRHSEAAQRSKGSFSSRKRSHISSRSVTRGYLLHVRFLTDGSSGSSWMMLNMAASGQTGITSVDESL